MVEHFAKNVLTVKMVASIQTAEKLALTAAGLVENALLVTTVCWMKALSQVSTAGDLPTVSHVKLSAATAFSTVLKKKLTVVAFVKLVLHVQIL